MQLVSFRTNSETGELTKVAFHILLILSRNILIRSSSFSLMLSNTSGAGVPSEVMLGFRDPSLVVLGVVASVCVTLGVDTPSEVTLSSGVKLGVWVSSVVTLAVDVFSGDTSTFSSKKPILFPAGLYRATTAVFVPLLALPKPTVSELFHTNCDCTIILKTKICSDPLLYLSKVPGASTKLSWTVLVLLYLIVPGVNRFLCLGTRA